MMAWLLSFLSGPLLTSLVNAYKAKLDAGNTRDAKAVDLAVAEISADIAARSAAKEIIIAEQGHWYTAIIRPLFALPFVIFIWKIVVYDKVLGLGVTVGSLDENMKQVLLAIIFSYFGYASIDRIAKVFKR
jgi:hypothetical protein